MKIRLVKRVLFLLPLLVFMACAAPKSNGPTGQTASLETVSKSGAEWPRNAYFYYLAARRELESGNVEKARQLLGKAILHDPRSTFLKMESALLLAEQGESRQALEIMRSVTAQDPTHAEALALLGKLEQEQKNHAAAAEAFERALQLDPAQVNVYLILGNAYAKKKDFDNARRIYKRLVDAFPDYYVGHFFLGKTLVEKGELEAGKKAFLRALELAPELLEARYALIDLYQKEKKPHEAVGLYREILKRNPDSIRSRLGLGLLYHQLGDLKASEGYLKSLGEESRKDPEIIRQLFNLYLDEKNYDAAIVILAGMLQGAPDASDLHYLMGIAHDGKENKTEAIRHMQQVRPDSKFYSNAVIHTAFLLQETGKTANAVALLKDVIRTMPDNAEFYLYLGSFYEEMEAFDQAEVVLKQGLEKDPDNAKILFRLGVVYDKSDRKEASIAAMKAVIRIDPKNANALNYLGYTYAELGRNLEEAENLIREALKHKPDDGYITDSLGWVYFKRGKFEEALKWLLKAVALVPEDPVILEHLGDIYRRMNDPKEALKYYRKSLELKKKDKKEIEEKINNLLKLIN
ncbi:MAG: tetratricopeptide repeat protein [Deltaproteobacteria bacterium]|nr:tetratricopeptide repeat protein [Deltaproteobacteria bacterium]